MNIKTGILNGFLVRGFLSFLSFISQPSISKSIKILVKFIPLPKLNQTDVLLSNGINNKNIRSSRYGDGYRNKRQGDTGDIVFNRNESDRGDKFNDI